MHDFSLTEAASQWLLEFGFGVELSSPAGSVDGRLTLTRNGQSEAFDVDVKRPLTLASVRKSEGLPNRLYVTDHVSTRTADSLRRLGVPFIDAAGNAFLAHGDWYLDVRGRRRPEHLETTRSDLGSSPNLYSAKRAQVVFALLTWPQFRTAPLRDLADAAGVSVGIAQSVTVELRRRELWPDHDDARWTLIDGWTAAFPGILAPSLTLRALRAEQFDSFRGAVFASGEAAPSAHLRATTGVVYVDVLTTELMAMNRWRTDGPPNLTVRRRFWSVPEPLAGEAPPLLVYGDLRASVDPRVRSVADDYRSRL